MSANESTAQGQEESGSASEASAGAPRLEFPGFRPLEVGEEIWSEDYACLGGELYHGTASAGETVLEEDLGLFYRPIGAQRAER